MARLEPPRHATDSGVRVNPLLLRCLGRVGAEMKELRVVLAVNGVDERQPLRGGDRLAGVLLVVARDSFADGLGKAPGVYAGATGDDRERSRPR
jgi:hypothetical protein